MQPYSRAEYVKRFGNAGSIAILDPPCSLFSHPSIEGIIGYHIAYGCAIVYGEPLCPLDALRPLSQAFHDYCQKRQLSVIYAVVSETFARKTPFLGTLVEFGEELFCNPQANPLLGADARKLRNKISLAERSGVTVEEFTSNDPLLRHEIETLGRNWLHGRKGPQIFLANVHLFSEEIGKRWFIAKKEEKVIGVALLNRLDAKQGWLFNLLLTSNECPGGTSELLVTKTLEILKQEECLYASFGPVTGHDLGEIEGLGKVATWCARSTFQFAKKIFALDAKKQYWKKYNPTSDKAYILSQERLGITHTLALMKALNVSYKG
jgi:lysylphosphatidylglycerol synthetase-like protein (DUF2156 family)